VKRGKCRLCEKETDIHNSHLIARAFYLRLRGKGRGNTDPHIVTSEGARSTSYQYRQHLLCKTCESRFKDGGEDYVLGISAQPDPFPLLEIITAANSKYYRENSYKACDAISTPSIDRSKIIYFAVSVFWRASIVNWRMRDGTSSVRIMLGSRYNEEIRKYLMGEGALPRQCALEVNVATDLPSRNVIAAPNGKHNDKVAGFAFQACGIHYNFAVGGRISNSAYNLSILKQPQQWIVAFSFLEHPPFVLKQKEKGLGRFL